MVTTTDLLSYWKLDESSGDAIDAHGSNDGTNTGVTQNASGKINTAYTYGTSADTDFGDVSTFDGGHMAISLWCKTGSVDTNDVLMTKRSAGVGWNIGTDGSKFTFIYEVGGTEVTLVSTTSISTSDIWQHVVCTYDGTTGRLFINGSEEDSSTAVSGNLVANSAACRLGEHSSAGGNNWNGEIDEIGFWGEVQSGMASDLYNSGSALAYPFAPPSTQITKDGTSRILIADTQKTSTGNARLQIDDTEEVYDGEARIEIQSQKTSTGNATLEIIDTQVTKEGKAFLDLQIQKTSIGEARIEIQSQKTSTGNAYISSAGQVTKQGDARIQIQDLQKTSSGNSRLEIQSQKTDTGNAAIEIQDNQKTSTGKAYISLDQINQKTSTGEAYLEVISVQDDFKPVINAINSTKPIFRSAETFN